LALVVSCTRVMDYMHTYSDIICGALYGVGTAVCAHYIFHKLFYGTENVYS